jgi:type I restriction enzyme S subunit
VQTPEDEQILQASILGVETKPLPHLLATTNMILHGIEVPSNIRHDNTLAKPLISRGPKDRVDCVVANPPFGGMEEDGIETNFPAAFRTRETADLFLVLIMHLLKDGGRAAVVLPDGFLFGEGIKSRIKVKQLATRGKLVPQHAHEGAATGSYRSAAGPFSLPSTWCWVTLGAALVLANGRAFKPSEWKKSGLRIVRIQNLNRESAEFNYASVDDIRSRHLIDTGTFLICWSGTPGTSLGAFIWNRGKAALNQHIFPCRQREPVFLDRFLQLAINARLDELIAKAHGGVGLQHVTKGTLEALALALPPLAEQHRIVAKVDELMALCDRLEARQPDAEAAHTRLVLVLLDSLTQARDAEEFQANWERVAGQFEVLFTTEDSIDALLQAIRVIAISGRLVPQRHDDECATSVLKQTAAMKAERGGRYATPVARIDQTKSLALPDRWVLTTVTDVTICRDGERIPVSKIERETRAKVYDYYGASGIIDKIDGFLFDEPLLLVGEDGANLINRSTPIAFIATGKYWVNIHAHVLDACSDTILAYLELFFNAIDFKSYVTGTAQPKLNQAKLNAIRIALPPEAEQRRIVDRVTELQSLCESLKSRLVVARGKHAQLAETLVAQALTA